MLLVFLVVSGLSQGAGTAETHLKITWQKCTKSGCSNQQGGIVVDSEWREVVDASGKSCLRDGNSWDSSVCDGEADCSTKCRLNGFNYADIGVTTTGSTVRLPFVTPKGDVGSRVYLYDESGGQYVLFKPINKEFTFDIETSTLACGINGALYFVEMDADGGTSKYPRNTAGAKYGTGYCDAQCPKDGKFIGNNANVGRKYGSCCFEWDIWEANAYATQFAAHPCGVSTAAYVCQSDCNQCDTSGCAWNHYRIGDHDYYGKGKKVNTNSKFTVVTQFISDNGQDSGNLREVRRLYVQGGKVIANNIKTYVDYKFDSINDQYCDLTSGDQAYKQRGGDGAFTKSFQRGQVLAMSIWTDGSMQWLDAGDAGPCTDPGGKDALVSANKNAYVEYSNIKFGDIDTTY
uniref:cellulase n=1 Tax=uncultured symbiotic protist of Cryptocercus punctulatus TaxID=403662 RepID=A4UX53_9EUKA|nr:putative glycosyl hydrolase family7 [uncultured symbiotic protist of Cryptocercus punctulatus]